MHDALLLVGYGLYVLGALGMAAWIDRTSVTQPGDLPIVRTLLSIWFWFLVGPYLVLTRRQR